MSTDYDFSSTGFNAGVFCLDLKKYRENTKFKSKANFLMEANKNGSLFRHNDQSILNIIFYNEVDFLDSKWNSLDYGWHDKKNEDKSIDNLESAKIVHYNGPEKPWLFDNLFIIPKYFEESYDLWKKYNL